MDSNTVETSPECCRDSSSTDAIEPIHPPSSTIPTVAQNILETESRHVENLRKTLGLLDLLLETTTSTDLQRKTMDQSRSISSSNLSSTDNVDHRDDHGMFGPKNHSMLDSLSVCPDTQRPISFLHDEVVEFDRIFTELATSSRRTSSTSSTQGGLLSAALSKCHEANDTRPSVPPDSPSLKIVETCPIPDDVFQTNATTFPDRSRPSSENLTNSDDVSISCMSRDNHTMGLIIKESGGCVCGRDVCQTVGGIENAAFVDSDAESGTPGGLEHSGKLTRRHSDSVLRSNPSMSRQFLRNQRRFNSFDLEKLNDSDVCGKFELPRNFDELNEDDNDSGYQTCDSIILKERLEEARLGFPATLLEIPDATNSDDYTDLQQRIAKYNLNNHGLTITLLKGNVTYEGFVRVYMNLRRPISMRLSSRPSSIYDILARNQLPDIAEEKKISSFYLPNDTFKVIHITSETTAQLLIKMLLTKFNITDSPNKFALYEKTISHPADGKHENLRIRRFGDGERPLETCLRSADQSGEGFSWQIVLQENDCGGIEWENFSLPELGNFLRILSLEESSYLDEIHQKFNTMKREMQKRLLILEDNRRCRT